MEFPTWSIPTWLMLIAYIEFAFILSTHYDQIHADQPEVNINPNYCKDLESEFTANCKFPEKYILELFPYEEDGDESCEETEILDPTDFCEYRNTSEIDYTNDKINLAIKSVDNKDVVETENGQTKRVDSVESRGDKVKYQDFQVDVNYFSSRGVIETKYGKDNCIFKSLSTKNCLKDDEETAKS